MRPYDQRAPGTETPRAGTGTGAAVAIGPVADPFRWLEQTDSDRALAWVRQQNARTRLALENQPLYADLHTRLSAVINDRARIPHVQRHGAWYYNFWRDAGHQRGIWRRTTPTQYRQAEPAWETVLDLDRLAREEHAPWVWGGADFLPLPANLAPQRCLVSLSRGGGDAQVLREFDLDLRAFVKDGFYVPEAKSHCAWIDADTLFVASDFGPGSLTASGYPRIVKEWRRGTPLAAAATVYSAAVSDLGVSARRDFTPGYPRQWIERQRGFYSSELYLRDGATLLRIAKPDDANAWAVRDQLLIELRSDWQAGGATYPAGALLATDFDAFLAGTRHFTVLFAPTATCALDGVTVTAGAVLVKLLDKVCNRLVEWRCDDGRWQARAVAQADQDHASIDVGAVDALHSDEYFMTCSSFLRPTTLQLAAIGSDAATTLKALPAFFDAGACQVRQHAARSADGTLVPYFVVRPRAAGAGDGYPTLLTGYGGFEVAMKPSYSGVLGAAWLGAGGAYVLANIRGGGEFGPAWHRAALKAHRQRAFDDFIAVAGDLVRRGLTRPDRLGILGGSNGGLLVGAAMTQRPELFGAVVCQVPLLDMHRYHRLLAGASWMDEYGNPDDPADWAYLARYSPYHNLAPGRHYPPLLLTTSTRDDRVHPAHARKMAARMQALGQQALYWENTEGGHGGAADNAQQAQMWALTYTFLRQTLADT
jgi:prolyl oligopeptidase